MGWMSATGRIVHFGDNGRTVCGKRITRQDWFSTVNEATCVRCLKKAEAERERPAILSLESWAGRTTRKVMVIGETPTRYRVRFEDDGPAFNFCGDKGAVSLVPKYAISFLETVR